MTAKDFYRTYRADNELSDLSYEIFYQIDEYFPVHVLEFGCGTGKHLNRLNKAGVSTIGIDISFTNCIEADIRYNLPCIIHADETYLRNLCNCDVVFTVSVLDHIENIDGIIGEFKRIANKAIFLAETNDRAGEFYFPHDYESYGFEKIDFAWTGEDGAKYFIYKWEEENIMKMYGIPNEVLECKTNPIDKDECQNFLNE